MYTISENWSFIFMTGNMMATRVVLEQQLRVTFFFFLHKCFVFSFYTPTPDLSPSLSPDSPDPSSSRTYPIHSDGLRTPLGSQESLYTTLRQSQAPHSYFKIEQGMPPQGMGSKMHVHVPRRSPRDTGRGHPTQINWELYSDLQPFQNLRAVPQ